MITPVHSFAGDVPMTQMLLFDTPTENSAVPVAATADMEAATEDQNIAAQLEHDSGLHHMGDLARLVLLRYELVAKRRARMAARKAASRAV